MSSRTTSTITSMNSTSAITSRKFMAGATTSLEGVRASGK